MRPLAAKATFQKMWEFVTSRKFETIWRGHKQLKKHVNFKSMVKNNFFENIYAGKDN